MLGFRSSMVVTHIAIVFDDHGRMKSVLPSEKGRWAPNGIGYANVQGGPQSGAGIPEFCVWQEESRQGLRNM